MNNTAGSAPRQVSSMYMSNMLRLDLGCWSLFGLCPLCVFVQLFYEKNKLTFSLFLPLMYRESSNNYDLFILETNVQTVVHAGEVHTLVLLNAILIVIVPVHLIKS